MPEYSWITYRIEADWSWTTNVMYKAKKHVSASTPENWITDRTKQSWKEKKDQEIEKNPS